MDGPWDDLEGEANCLLGLKDFLFDQAVQVKSSKYKMLERILLYGTFETIDSKLHVPRVAARPRPALPDEALHPRPPHLSLRCSTRASNQCR